MIFFSSDQGLGGMYVVAEYLKRSCYIILIWLMQIHFFFKSDFSLVAVIAAAICIIQLIYYKKFCLKMKQILSM